MNTELSTSIKQSVSAEVEEFLSKVKNIYSTNQVEFEHSENEVFNQIMSLVIPNLKEDKTNKSTILPNIPQIVFNQETQKNQEKKYCAKEVVQNNGITKFFGSPGSAFVSHISNRDSLTNIKTSLNFVIPVCEIKTPFHKIITSQIDKEESLKDIEHNKSDDDCLGKNSKKQYKVYCPELKTQIVEYAFKHSSRQASQKYHVSTSKISIWSKSFAKSKQTRGRKTVDPQMEDKVCQWLEEQFDKGSLLTQRIIRQKAKKISKLQNFKASKGWLQKFFKRRPALFKAYSQNRQGCLQNLQINEMNKEQQEKRIKEGQYQSESVSCQQMNDD